MTRILVKGKTKTECEKEVEKKIKGGWAKVTEVIEDKSYIGGRFVCIMHIPDNGKRNKFNNYMGKL